MVECHKIMERDVQAGIAMAWHGLTKVVETVTKEVAFPFDFKRVTIYVNSPKLRKVSGFSVFVCDDDGEVAGRPVPDTYHALTNARFWDIIGNATGGTDAIVESAGTLIDRSRRFVTLSMSKNPDFTVGKRKFLNRITFLDSIDGSTYFHAVNTSICTVCANTWRMTLNSANEGAFKFKIRHTNGMPEAIEGMEQGLNQLVGVAGQFKGAMEAANAEKMNEDQARNVFAGWIGTGADMLSTRARNTVARLTGLFNAGAGNDGETVADAWSAVTDFYSHESSGGEDKPGFRMKQTISSDFGAGNRAKADFFGNLFLTDNGGANKSARVLGVNRDNIATLEIRGRNLLAISGN